MNKKSDTELANTIEKLTPPNLTDSDKKILLNFFNNTHNAAIRHRIALLLSDVRYNEAIPFIIKKINEKELYNRNGTLVYALDGLDSLPYFVELIEIICSQGYEARLMAYSIVKNFSNLISTDVKERSLALLESYRLRQPEIDDVDYEDSPLHFIEATEKLLL